MATPNVILSENLQLLKKVLSKETKFCLPNQKESEELVQILKNIFDVSTNFSARPYGPLETLYTENLDEETIWEQVQTKLRPWVRHLEKKTVKLMVPIDNLVQKYEKRGNDNDESVEQETDSDGENDSLNEDESQDMEDGGEDSEEESIDINDDEEYDEDDERLKRLLDEEAVEGEEDDEEEEEEEEDEDEDQDAQDDDMESGEYYDEAEDGDRDQPNRGPNYDSDEDLKMESWLDDFEEMVNKHQDKEEERERRLRSKDLTEDDEWDEEEDDMAAAQKAMYEEDSDDEDNDADGANIRYDDYFVSDKNKNNNKNKNNVKQQKQVKFQGKNKGKGHDEDEDDFNEFDEEDEEDEGDEDQDDFEEEEEDDIDEEDENNNKSKKAQQQPLTKFGRKQQLIQEEIAALENQLMNEKSWELRGEVKASQRPENSLLEVAAVDIDRNSKVAPVVTQEFSSSLEEMIIKRIKDGRFNDPLPRESRSTDLVTGEAMGKKDDPLDLSQDKDKKGLGEIYADEYAKTVMKQDTSNMKDEELKQEILSVFNKLSRSLDALSHFYYTPKPVAPEASAQVLANKRLVPAIEMEDISPAMGMNSTAAVQAPEEIFNKKRGKVILQLSKEEMTHDDRRKMRRHVKNVQRKHTAVKKLKGDGNDNFDITRDKRVKIGKDSKEGGSSSTAAGGNTTNSEYTKSTSFFSQLQKQTEQDIANKSHGMNKRKQQNDTEDSHDNKKARSNTFKL